MENKSIASLLVGTWNTKTIVTVAIGAALFGVLMVYASFPIFANTYVSAMLIPVIVGAMFGPLAALVAAAVGNIVADLIGGWGVWFDWSVGNGLAAFFVGLLAVYGARVTEVTSKSGTLSSTRWWSLSVNWSSTLRLCRFCRLSSMAVS